jgi:hypothetical protein
MVYVDPFDRHFLTVEDHRRQTKHQYIVREQLSHAASHSEECPR